ncbi:MAG: ACT domain-containing protein [Bacteroidales bacterium]|nr:ACT domain-containing protein [Bacteroidales bacterium]
MKNRIEMEDEIRNYTVLIYTENQIGLLAQISNVFTRRSLSIWTLSAGPTAIEGIHTITITTDATRRRIEDAVKQIEKRVDVISATF